MCNIDPLVSVIISTHNRVYLLRHALQSVLDQTYQNLEIIIVDDASNDMTQKFVSGIADKRVIYLRHNLNKGPSAARNTGIQSAHGQYICFLDDDDSWLPEKVEKQIHKFGVLPDVVGLVYCGCNIVSGKNGKVIDRIYPKFRGKVLRKLLYSCFLLSPTIMVKKKLLDKTRGFDEKLESSEDWDMWLRLSKICNFDFVDSVLANYYIHGDHRISFNDQAKINGKKYFIDKHLNDLSRYPAALSCQFMALAKHYCIFGSLSEGREYILKALRLKPLDFNYHIHFALSYIFPQYYVKLLKNRCYKHL